MSLQGQAVESSGINPNEEVTEASDSKVIGDEQLSWDDLDKIEANAEKKAAAEEKAKKADVSETGKGKKGKEKAESGDPKKAEQDQDVDEKEGKSDVDQEPQGLKATFNNKRKTFEIDLGGDKGKVELPRDTEFTVKSDGEIKTVPLRELIDSYSGEVAVKERLGKISEMDRGIRASGEALRRTALDTIETIKADPIAGLSMIAQIAGDENPDQFANQFFTKIQEMASEMIGKSPAEQEAAMLRMQLQSRDTRDSLAKQREERFQQEQMSRKQTEEIMEKHGMTAQDWYDSKYELQENGVPADQIDSRMIVEHNAKVNVRDIIRDGVPELYQRMHEPEIEEILEDAFEELTGLYISGDNNKQELTELLRDTLSPFLEEKPKAKVSENVKRLNEKLDRDSRTRMSENDNSDPLRARKERFQNIEDSIWSM